MSERWAIAPTLPITIVAAASAASAGRPVELRQPERVVEQAQEIANAAALVATAMNVVIGVGAPW